MDRPLQPSRLTLDQDGDDIGQVYAPIQDNQPIKMIYAPGPRRGRGPEAARLPDWRHLRRLGDRFRRLAVLPRRYQRRSHLACHPAGRVREAPAMTGVTGWELTFRDGRVLLFDATGNSKRCAIGLETR